MRIGVVILPDLRWPAALGRWQEAERRGFATAWTYDHLSWRTLRDRPWLGAVPLLSAVAASTTRLRLGTMVATPNFRHPVLLAKDVMTLDEISGGRMELGLGAGGAGYDAAVLGADPLPAAENAARFEEFVDALDVMLREPATSYHGRFYTAVESRTLPGCTQDPRVPFTIAATGRRGLALAARQGRRWVTYGPITRQPAEDEWFVGIKEQVAALDLACEAIGRDPATIDRVALLSLEVGWAQSSVGAWEDVSGRLAAMGFSDVVVHWPRPDDPDLPGPPEAVFDEISRRQT